MKIDPYATLGVDRDASPEDIKSAFRAKAKETHPDAGGDAKDFEKVKLANIVLVDPARRAKYDNTGTIDEDTPENPLAQSVSIIMRFIDQVIQEHVVGGKQDPETVDIIQVGIHFFEKQIETHLSNKAALQRGLEKTIRMERRFKNKPGKRAFINIGLTQKQETFRKMIETCDQQADAHRRAIDLIREYDFEAEAENQFFATSVIIE